MKLIYQVVSDKKDNYLIVINQADEFDWQHDHDVENVAYIKTQKKN